MSVTTVVAFVATVLTGSPGGEQAGGTWCVMRGLLSCLSRTLCCGVGFVGVVEAGGVLVGEDAADDEVVVLDVAVSREVGELGSCC